MFNSPVEIIKGNMEGAKAKAALPLGKMILLGMMAGAFIAIGGATSSTAVHDIANVGLARTLAGVIFPVGLMMIVLCGGELFTGNCLISMGVMHHEVKLSQMLRNLIVVYFSNLAGALIVDALICFSGNLDYTGGALGAYTIKVALGKATIDPVKAFVSGILCNILVCAAVLMAMCARDIVGKLFACFFTIMLFVVAGYEHCIANMYYIPAGLIAARNQNYVQMAMDTYGYTSDQLSALNLYGFFVKNLVPVTIGNIIGGAVLGLILLYLHGYDKKKAA